MRNTMTILIITSFFMLPFAGCYYLEKPAAMDRQSDNASSQRTQQRPSEGPTAVESAIAISDKYAKLSEEASMLRQQKQTLDVENQRLKDELQNCRSQLAQAQKELGEANNLLAQMRLELNNWKENVLGYRDEMRDAEKAQLEALLKILKLLGAETNQPGNPDKSGQTQVSEEQK